MSTRDRSEELSEEEVVPAGPDAEPGGENVELARRVRDVCVRTFLEAYEDAGIQGLCADGRLEVAVEAVRRLDLSAVCRGGDPPKAEGAANGRRRSHPD